MTKFHLNVEDTVSDTDNITGLILAGGAGTRVDGKDKGLLLWQGRPLVTQVAERLRPQIGKLLISCNRNRDEYATIADLTIGDKREDFQGPLAGIEAAIPHITTQFLVIVACDTPLIPPDLAMRLIAGLTTGSNGSPQISVAYDGERSQYLHAAIRVSCLPSLPIYMMEGHRTVRHWYRLHSQVTVNFEDQPGCFANYNNLSSFPPEEKNPRAH
ncbi:MAG: molybdenum cofactor guanylyltransferase [Halieaceae bacterium]|jgi:molybdenum cofactor guanylyltransferase|nr:molybdenum cofactor guanylyltransferase [Halieaceae bacterium]